jgi:hypothetical protein
MNDAKTSDTNPESGAGNLKKLIEDVVREFHAAQAKQQEPVYRAELAEERRQREEMERQLRDLIEENRRAKERAEQIETASFIKTELQKLGVTKIDLAYRAIKDDVQKDSSGRFAARSTKGVVPIEDYLKQFVEENPELLPARNVSGTGGHSVSRRQNNNFGIELESIRPGMSQEELAKVRQEIARVAGLMID